MNRSSFLPVVVPSLGTSLRLCITGAVVLISLAASAQTPAPPAGGTPSASQLQTAHNLGKDTAADHFEQEVIPHGGPPPKDLLRPKFDEFMKGPGARFTEAEKEVFTEAYWSKYEQKRNKFGEMTEIDPLNRSVSEPSTTTNVSGKTPTPGPGTVQLTDKDGNSYFVDVDANGNYSTTVPQGNFQPVKATLWTKTGKLERIVRSDGTWAPVSSATGTGTQGAMAPGGAAITGNAAYALLDECKKHLMLSSAGISRPTPAPQIHRVRLMGGVGGWSAPPESPVRLVSDPLPPDLVREAQKQGIEHADRQFEKMQIEKTPASERTQAQKDRLKELDQMIQEFEDGQKLIRDPNNPNNKFVAKEIVQAADIALVAAQARRLQQQAEAIRAGGTPGSDQVAKDLEAAAQALMGGQPLPPLPDGGTGMTIEGTVVDHSWKPIIDGMAVGATIFGGEHPKSLDKSNVDKQLRDAPIDGCPPKGETNGEGEFKLKVEYQWNWGGSKLKLGPTYNYTEPPFTDPGTKQDQQEAPAPPKTPEGAFYRSSVGSNSGCAYAHINSFLLQVGLTYAKEPWTLNVETITLDTNPGYNLGFMKGTDVGSLFGALTYLNISPGFFILDQTEADGLAGLGHLQADWNTTQTFQWEMPKQIQFVEEDSCISIAPAPSWDPAHWPTLSASPLPALHIKVSELHD